MTNLGSGNFNARFPDTSNSFSFAALPNTATMDFGYLNSVGVTAETSVANAANTPLSQWPQDPGNEAAALQSNKTNNLLNTPGNFIGGMTTGTMTGQPLKAGAGIDWNGYFVRATVIILGFVFVAAGLYMFGDKRILQVAAPR